MIKRLFGMIGRMWKRRPVLFVTGVLVTGVCAIFAVGILLQAHDDRKLYDDFKIGDTVPIGYGKMDIPKATVTYFANLVPNTRTLFIGEYRESLTDVERLAYDAMGRVDEDVVYIKAIKAWEYDSDACITPAGYFVYKGCIASGYEIEERHVLDVIFEYRDDHRDGLAGAVQDADEYTELLYDALPDMLEEVDADVDTVVIGWVLNRDLALDYGLDSYYRLSTTTVVLDDGKFTGDVRTSYGNVE